MVPGCGILGRYGHAAVIAGDFFAGGDRPPLYFLSESAIFSLSLMGANFADYLREAYRTLKLDGQLHVIEATSRFANRDQFVKGLEALGFAVVTVEDKWKFTHIGAQDRAPAARGH